ncbi:UDP-N-acetylenolpyruvoylglucosamine reductase [Caldithrix abyssi DSM 13497]|uniref:UDP-N-acetylenolpyruvoylglucosamine reductase n=1 Tax=Caldithrix abyssi DSM 13497 TaxID=880073 RepID=H1XYH6_CALAY|nr:FAD-binding protein [Caldithrix abyssi]APF19678.1 murB UDP-N-acetylmuramate dehydrogenase [Caldithrix abyssi DSM 13497]EHO39794.1 UDP-N-acetylenolpyruvoylglucosamine reductase [Caldithrix abyssi DSM 13497]
MNVFIKTALKMGLNVLTDFPLAPLTTFGIGGPAKYYLKVHTAQQLMDAMRLARQFDLPFKVLGQASNVLISDAGYNGLIIHNHSAHFEELPAADDLKPPVFPRFPELFEVNAKDCRPLLLRIASGMRLSALIRAMHRQNMLGLEWFAGIPATTGGALYMNAHGGPCFFGDFVHSARLFDGRQVKSVDASYFRFAYDYSILHQTGEIVLDVVLYGWQGPVDRAKQFYKWWASQKRIQPQTSAGCIFQNLDEQDRQRLNLPTSSVGYFIDRVLGVKGVRKGGAIISNAHAAFIENTGKARASDVLFLINLIKNEALNKTGVRLKLEIELIGFDEM